jgi:hypothetical protein
MTSSDEPIPVTGLKSGTVQVATELHITGGLRAFMQGQGLWSLRPLLRNGATVALNALPIDQVRALVARIGAEVFGGNEISGLGTPLLSRSWSPLDAEHDGQMQPAITWSLIAGTAHRSGDDGYASLASNLSHSLHAAGIGLRDASDCYDIQLRAAIAEKRKAATRFSNIPMLDLQLAFHSVLSELASARDYLAAALAMKLGALAKVDALNRFADWLKPSTRVEIRAAPVVSEMLKAYDKGSTDPWLYELTEYRNLFLHRQPLGAASGAKMLRYDETEVDGFIYPTIAFPLGDTDQFAPGIDALLRFVGLYRQMTALARLAAIHAPYEAKMQHFVAS